MQPDYEYWMRLDEWPLEAAIFLLLDFDPRCPDADDIWQIIWQIVEGYRGYVHERFNKDPLKGIIRKARDYKTFAWTSHWAGKLHLGGIRNFRAPTVEPERWLRWAQSKELPLPNPLQDFLKEIEQRGKSKPTLPTASDAPLRNPLESLAMADRTLVGQAKEFKDRNGSKPAGGRRDNLRLAMIDGYPKCKAGIKRKPTAEEFYDWLAENDRSGNVEKGVGTGGLRWLDTLGKWHEISVEDFRKRISNLRKSGSIKD